MCSHHLCPPPLPPFYGWKMNPNVASPNVHNYDWNAVMAMAAIGCIFTVFATTVAMYCIYFRCCYGRVEGRMRRSRPWRAEISRGRRFSWTSVDAHYYMASPTLDGLSSAAVEALPLFVFNALRFKEGMRCAVCLCDFEENERGRILPNCGHSFHVECIDMWFYSHSTCPLCRQGVERVVDSSAEHKIVAVGGSSGSEYENDGAEERKEMEGGRSEEAVVVVADTEDSHPL